MIRAKTKERLLGNTEFTERLFTLFALERDGRIWRLDCRKNNRMYEIAPCLALLRTLVAAVEAS